MQSEHKKNSDVVVWEHHRQTLYVSFLEHLNEWHFLTRLHFILFLKIFISLFEGQ